jgi:hypothetical protein
MRNAIFLWNAASDRQTGWGSSGNPSKLPHECSGVGLEERLRKPE